jgi:glycosyltransferase involved in cell wall biosynthesis
LGLLTYFWPMVRTVVESARLVVVHNEWLAAQLRDEYSDARIRAMTMGVPELVAGPQARERICNRHGIPADAVVFMGFGKVTPEKRISEVIRALASSRDVAPKTYVLLVGEGVDHYKPSEEAHALGVSERVVLTGFVPDEELPDYLNAADVCLCMRWPSSRETSASWLRCLAAGRATITTDLVHTVDVPALDPRSWTILDARACVEASHEPVCVSIDILDEQHSLRLAMRRLADDTGLRRALGRSARKLWLERFTLEQMVSSFGEIIETARALPPPDSAARARMPAHLVSDGTEMTGRLLGQMRLSRTDIAGLWSR